MILHVASAANASRISSSLHVRILACLLFALVIIQLLTIVARHIIPSYILFIQLASTQRSGLHHLIALHILNIYGCMYYYYYYYSYYDTIITFITTVYLLPCIYTYSLGSHIATHQPHCAQHHAMVTLKTKENKQIPLSIPAVTLIKTQLQSSVNEGSPSYTHWPQMSAT